MTDDAKGERERCAKVCDDISADLWAQYKGRPPHEPMNPNRANPHVQGQSDGASMCAEAIRALAPAQAQRVEPVVAYMYQRKDGRGVTNLATIEERVPLIDLHDWCEIPLYRGPDKLPPSEPMACAECGANLQCAYDQRHGIVDPPPRTESAASAAPWTEPPPIVPPPIVSDEIADISLACTPTASAEDAPTKVQENGKLRSMANHLLTATALTGAELIHIATALTDAAAELTRLRAALDAANARADAMATAVAELRNIRDAVPSKWDESQRDQFQQWAQNRARYTLAAIDGSKP